MPDINNNFNSLLQEVKNDVRRLDEDVSSDKKEMEGKPLQELHDENYSSGNEIADLTPRAIDDSLETLISHKISFLGGFLVSAPFF